MYKTELYTADIGEVVYATLSMKKTECGIALMHNHINNDAQFFTHVNKLFFMFGAKFNINRLGFYNNEKGKEFVATLKEALIGKSNILEEEILYSTPLDNKKIYFNTMKDYDDGVNIIFTKLNENPINL